MLDALLRDFNLAFEAAVADAASNGGALQALLDKERAALRGVVVTPYPSPEDLAESAANDYGQWLKEHHEKTVRRCEAELRKLT